MQSIPTGGVLAPLSAANPADRGLLLHAGRARSNRYHAQAPACR